MNFRPMLIINPLLIAGMAAASAWAWTAIPGSTQVPIHFGLDGTPDRLAGKVEALLVMPLVASFLTLLMWGVPRVDPRRANIEASGKFWNAAGILTAALLAYVHVLVILIATGYKLDMLSALIPGLSVLFIGLGNYLGKTRANWFGGIRTPWTLSSDYAWEKTHRLGGRAFVLCGVTGFVAWLVLDPKVTLFVLIAAIVAASFGSIIASYFYWRADPERAARQAAQQQS